MTELVRDPYYLDRFLAAQEPVFGTVLRELHAAAKKTHWMWFVFPQAAGLGSSAMARRYALGSLAETRAYADHPVLGARLRECTATVLESVEGRTAHDVFGSPDDLKFRSSLTLFAAIDAGDVFVQALAKFFDGERDPATIAIMHAWR